MYSTVLVCRPWTRSSSTLQGLCGKDSAELLLCGTIVGGLNRIELLGLHGRH